MQKQLDKINQPLGHIDGMFQHGLTGWFHGGLEGSNIVQLRLNGEPVTSTQAVDSRPDVEEFHGFGKNSGFTFDVRALEELGEPGEIFELTISDSNNVFNFGGATIRYCVGTAKWYNEIQAIFDANFYRSRYNLCNLSREAAFRHFINGGIFEAMDPCPWFSSEFYTKNYSASLGDGKLPLIAYLENESTLEEQPAYNFDPNYYYKQYADIATVISPLAHYVRHGRFENRSAYENVLPAVVLDEYEDILELEPKLSTARSGLDHIVRYPHNNEALHLSKLVHDRVGDDIKVVVCVPFISRGGADLISTFLFRAYQTVYGKEHVLMLVTDKSSIDVPEWIDDGSQVICLDDEATFVNAEDKLLAFHSCIGKIAPEKILNVNSHLAWRLFERHGMQLASVVDLYAFLFCFDYNKDRDKVGYIVDYLPKTLRFLKKVYFDNKKIIEDIERIYGFSAELRQKLHTVYVPAAEGLEQADYAQSDRRDTVLWVGRLSLQKRPDVLVEIAKLLPGQKFDVYGPPGNSECSADIVEGKIPNINYRGVYNSLDEIDCSQYSSFLNTSEWDGLPTIIIQMMALGLPVVTSSICGIPELINDQNGWPVSTFDDPEEYAITLRKVSIKKQLTVKKTNKAKADVMKIHQWQSFYKRLELLEAFSDFSSNERVYAPSLEKRQTA